MSVARSTILFSAGTFLSRLSGLLRDIVVVSVFGASSLLDAFIVANRIPNLFREMLAEGALGSAFTKVFASLHAEDPRRARQLLADSLVLATLFCIGLCAIGIIAAPYIVELFTLMAHRSDRAASFYTTTVALTRVLFPFLLFAVLAAISMGALHQRGRFFLTGIAPALLNAGYIFGALVLAGWLAQRPGGPIVSLVGDPAIAGLAVGVLVGGALHLGVQFMAVTRDFLAHAGIRWRIAITDDVRNVISIMIPAAVAASAASINVLINTNFATSLDTGAVTWLNYAFRLLQLPVGLFGVAVGVAVLPTLSRAIANAGRRVDAQASRHLQNAIEFVVWLMIPCGVFLLVNAESLVRLLFEYGRFLPADSQATGECLFAYGFGVLAYGLIKVLTSFYYSVERTSYAMRVSLTAIGINFLVNVLVIERYEHVGLAGATAFSLSCNALLLAWGLRGEGIRWDASKLLTSFGLLSIGIPLAWGAQKFCKVALSGLDLPSVSLKMTFATTLLANGLVVVGVFFILGWLRIGEMPLNALRKPQV